MKPFGNLRAVLWDMDGVVVDSWQTHLDSLRQVMGAVGYEVPMDVYKRSFGMTNQQVIRNITQDAFDQAELDALAVEKDRVHQEMLMKDAHHVKGVRDWLERFQKNGIRQALASSGSNENIRVTLSVLGALPFFDALVSGEDSASKPDPAVFIHASTELGIPPEDCLVIEDSPAGLQAATAAGMRCLAITSTNSAAKLEGAALILPDLSALEPQMLRQLFPEQL